MTSFHTQASSEPKALYSHPQNTDRHHVSFPRGQNETHYSYYPQNKTQGKIQTLVATHICFSPYVTSRTFTQLLPSLYPYQPPNHLAFVKQTTFHTPSHAVLTDTPTRFGARRRQRR